ncbi:1491_t:CDS:2, partial [Entrophospora sp. SA101]
MDNYVEKGNVLDFTQDGFHKDLIKWIIVNDHNFSVVENTAFKKNGTKIESKTSVPSSDTVRNMITESFDNQKQQLKEELKASP